MKSGGQSINPGMKQKNGIHIRRIVENEAWLKQRNRRALSLSGNILDHLEKRSIL